MKTPLDWTEDHCSCIANSSSSIGYAIYPHPGTFLDDHIVYWKVVLTGINFFEDDFHPSIESAKAAAQAHSDAISDAVEEVKPKWISVEDGLPKSTEWVLTARSSGHYSTPIEYLTGQCDPTYKGWVQPDNSRFTDSGSLPTHWMPLPELPKGEAGV